nr:MFS transporter [Leifsonia sp. Leaf325]
MFRSLSGYNYRIWFVGALVSNIGGWMQSTTQDWVVLTQLTQNSAVAVGFTMALQFGPQLVLVPFTGLVADRFDRRRILLVTQSVLMLLAVGLGVLLLAGHAELWHLYAFALALGITNAFDAPARQSFVSDLVSGQNTSNAVALNAASFNTARLIGPAVAGLLIVVIGSGWVFIVNAFTFIAMLAALVMLRRDELRLHPKMKRARGQFVQGFRYVATRPDLKVVFVIVFLVSAFGMNFPIFASTMAVEFGEGAGEYGLLSSILAIGSLTAALLSARRSRARLRVVIAATGFFGLAALAASLMPSYATFAVSLIFIGFGTVTLLTTANGYVQTTVPGELRGRVLALYMALLMGGTLFGAPIIGWVADAFGPRWGLGVAAIAATTGFVIGACWMFFSRGVRLVRVPQTRWRFAVASVEAADAIAVGDRVTLPGATRPGVRVTDAAPTASRHPLPEDFSDELALTSPIPLPKLPPRDAHGHGHAHAHGHTRTGPLPRTN